MSVISNVECRLCVFCLWVGGVHLDGVLFADKNLFRSSRTNRNIQPFETLLECACHKHVVLPYTKEVAGCVSVLNIERVCWVHFSSEQYGLTLFH